MDDTEEDFEHSECVRRGRLYSALRELFRQEGDHKKALLELSHQHGRTEVQWMLEVIKMDIEAGKDATNSGQIEWQTDRNEEFVILGSRFDVQAAKKLIVAKPREIIPIDINSLAFCARWVATFWRIKVESDLSVPLIMAVLGGGYLLIDGYHRLHRAQDKKVGSLPTVRLTPDETRSILVVPNDAKKGRKK